MPTNTCRPEGSKEAQVLRADSDKIGEPGELDSGRWGNRVHAHFICRIVFAGDYPVGDAFGLTEVVYVHVSLDSDKNNLTASLSAQTFICTPHVCTHLFLGWNCADSTGRSCRKVIIRWAGFVLSCKSQIATFQSAEPVSRYLELRDQLDEGEGNA